MIVVIVSSWRCGERRSGTNTPKQWQKYTQVERQTNEKYTYISFITLAVMEKDDKERNNVSEKVKIRVIGSYGAWINKREEE